MVGGFISLLLSGKVSFLYFLLGRASGRLSGPPFSFAGVFSYYFTRPFFYCFAEH